MDENTQAIVEAIDNLAFVLAATASGQNVLRRQAQRMQSRHAVKDTDGQLR